MKDKFNCRVDATYVNDGDKWDGALHYTDNSGKDVYSTKKTSNADSIEEVYLDLISQLFPADEEQVEEKPENLDGAKLDEVIKRLESVEKRLAAFERGNHEDDCCNDGCYGHGHHVESKEDFPVWTNDIVNSVIAYLYGDR